MQKLMSRRHFALIPAAGIGLRMGGDGPKQYMRIAGKPMLLHTLDTFAASPTIIHTYVVVSPDDSHIDDVLAAAPHLSSRITIFRNGGATRQQSVLNGLCALREQLRDDDWILVHDAARPGLTTALIDRLVNDLHDDAVGGLLALPVVDTLKRSDAEQRAQATISREALWAAQTPQMFSYELLCRALTQAIDVTDEASAIEALGLRPKLVEGSQRNFKVTLPHDVALAELYLKGLA